MKWWVWLIIFVLVVAGVFFLYIYLTADKKKNDDQLAKAREAKESKRSGATLVDAEMIIENGTRKKYGLKAASNAGTS